MTLAPTESPKIVAIRAAVPVMLQIFGLIGFIVAQVLWVAFDRPEPQFMAICVGVAATGYVGAGLTILRSGPTPPPTPPAPTT